MPKIIDDARVFQAVLQVLLQHGYAQATTRRLAEAAGISEVSLFRRYGSKAELVRRAIRAIAEEMAFEEVVRYTGDVRADLRRVVERYLALVTRYGPFFAALLPDVQRHPELRPALERPLQVWGQIAGLLQRYQEEGVLVPEPPMQALAALFGPLIFGELARALAGETRAPLVDAEEHVRRFLEGRRR